MADTAGYQSGIWWVILHPFFILLNGFQGDNAATAAAVSATGGAEAEGQAEEDENAPLDLSWPDSCRERITYLLFLPIIIPLWLTLPDTRKSSGICAKKQPKSESYCYKLSAL